MRKWLYFMGISLVSINLFAQTNTVQLEDIVINATKSDLLQKDLTSASTVISGESIRDKNITDLTEAFRFTPGLEFKQAGGPGQFNYPIMRGLGSGHFLVVIDGVKMTEGLSGGVSYLLGQIDPQIVDKIEIIRGPKSILYGSDSIAGVISITTKKGAPGLSSSLGAEYGSLNWKKGYASMSGGNDEVTYNVSIPYINSDGVHAEEGYRSFSPQLKIGVKEDNLNADFTAWYLNSKFDYAETYESYSDHSADDKYWGFQVPDPNQFNERDQYFTSLNSTWKISDQLKQKLLIGYVKIYTKSEDLDDGLLGYAKAPYDNFLWNGSGTYMGSPYAKGDTIPMYDNGSDKAYKTENENLSVDYNLIHTVDLEQGYNTALAGIEYFGQSGKKRGRYGDLDADVDVWSFYLHDQIKLNAISLNAGARYDHHETFNGHWTGSVGGKYDISKTDSSIFLNYGTSFKAPTFFNLFDPKYGNEELDPETAWTLDGGIRQTFMNGKGQFEITGWWTKLDDMIAFDWIAGKYSNSDNAETKGVEVAFSYSLLDSLVLSGNYTYTDASEKDGGKENDMPLVAPNKANLDLTYYATKYILNAHMYYSDKRYRWKGDFEMDSYVRCDVSARFKVADDWSVYARIENLFDADITEGSAYENPGVYAIAGVEWTPSY